MIATELSIGITHSVLAMIRQSDNGPATPISEMAEASSCWLVRLDFKFLLSPLPVTTTFLCFPGKACVLALMG